MEDSGLKIFFEQDSSMVTVRAAASALKGEMFSPYKVAPYQEALLRLTSIFGREAVSRIAAKFSCNIGIHPEKVSKVNSSLAARWTTARYKGSGKCNAVIVGAPSGGAAHLSTMLKAPFLTQHFLLCIKHRKTAPDDIKEIAAHGITAARKIRKNDEALEVIVHYDPVHDRLLAGCVNTVRLKLTALPKEYRNFINQKLKPGGAVIFIDVKYTWLQYAVEDHIHIQVGGLGGISDKEYLNGSERLDRWLTSIGSPHRGGWQLSGYPLEAMPESEWGTYPGLKDELKEFAGQNGYKFIEISADHPEQVSEIAAELFIKHVSKPTRWFFDCFTSINPFFNLSTGAVPVWLPFNCSDSYSYAENFLENKKDLFSDDSIIYFTLTPNFVATPDQVEPAEWHKLFSRYGKAKPVAVNWKLYPADVTHFILLPKALRREAVRVSRAPISLSTWELEEYLAHKPHQN